MNKFTLGLMALLFILIFMTAMVLNDVKSETIQIHAIEVQGESLKQTAGTVEGVIQAEWNEETKELEVVFDGTKTDISSIETAIEESGILITDSVKNDLSIQKTFEDSNSIESDDSKTTLSRNAKSKAVSY